MVAEFPVEKTVRARRSVRTYEERPLSKEDKEKITSCIAALSNPFSVKVSIGLLEKKSAANGEKLGTYGVIKGAGDYLGAAVTEGELSLEALGYSFEKLILYAAALGLGTCWLGGTFNRSGFSEAMGIKENELFPAISPIGYPLDKRRVTDTLSRWLAKADKRKGWEELFYQDDFSHPLTETEAGDYAFPLEMLRLAPSAVNKQPWRVVKKKNSCHFYKTKNAEDTKTRIDIQRVDVGIAACHFHLAALEKKLPGEFKKLTNPGIQSPEQLQYIFSWVGEK
ncbi:nitroreductase family protein [Anaerocolumna jejuensis]|uniref:nitroreductase family protein n=1 Tax=Anaerocolumna jejuensis TaxID=259063 RepID=UPI003F7BBA13